MPRFICHHPTMSLVKHITPSGKVLAFDYRRVLDTDAEGAAVIRADPLYGRLILEGGESAPAHREVPAHGTSPAAVREWERPARRPAGSWMDPHGAMVECLACGRRFVQESWTPRLYCDAKCRGAAYRARRRARPRAGKLRTAQDTTEAGCGHEESIPSADLAPLQKGQNPIFGAHRSAKTYPL
jgi:hypothetical protein